MNTHTHPKRKALFGVVVWLLVIFMLAVLSFTQASLPTATAAEPESPGALTLNTNWVQLPDELMQAMLELLRDRSSAQRVLNPLSAGERYVLTSARMSYDGHWALISLAPDGPEYLGSGEAGKLVVAHREIGEWRLEIEGNSAFAELITAAPDSFIAPRAKALLLQTPNSNSPQTLTYKWPWLSGLQWHWWQGFHGGGGLDMGTAGSDRRVLASAGGVINYMCKGPLGAAIKIRDDDGLVLEYWHIDANALGEGINLGATVAQGQVLGSLRPGSWTDTACGPQYTGQSADNAHLHWVLPKDRPFTVEGWTISYPSSSFARESQTRTCNGGCWNSQIFFASSNTLDGSPGGPTHTPAPSKTPTSTATPTPTPTATPTPGSLLLVLPDRAVVKAGSLMTLTVALSRTDVLDLSGLQFDLSYSPTLLSMQAVAPGELLTGTGPVFTATWLSISNTLGLISLQISRTSAITANSPGEGALLHVLAQANEAGLAEVQFASVHLTHTTGNTHTAEALAGRVLIVNELPSPRAYLPITLRKADVGELTPTATQTATAQTATATFPPTATRTPTLTATSTSTPTPTQAEPETPTPTPTQI